ncbi:c-type cytochrome [Falsiruegeria mediterranea]|jgi:cytochrome c|uniref:Cytochrome c2 n=1 Tax=Falsiruegeria mediterranea M17 TaxID=1200281 RepID=A0A2R8C6G9_9RHOB|nr:cytochrome c family protein [Falsiruegeria mediterranea]SPJ28030.1 Cytochrome c2 [Falsiruegeria mediterranea M17]
MKRLIIGAALVLSVLNTGAWAEGDAKAGKKVFKKCKACHTVKEGKNKVGPTLYGIVDAPAGQVEGFKYSPALLEAGLTWDAETLKAFLTKPKELVPGNKMSFAGLKKEQQIDDLIAYLVAESEE